MLSFCRLWGSVCFPKDVNDFSTQNEVTEVASLAAEEKNAWNVASNCPKIFKSAFDFFLHAILVCRYRS